MTDAELGHNALKNYFSWMKSTYPKTYANHNYDSFYLMLTKVKGAKNLADGIGTMINSVNLSTLKTNEAMKKLALSGGGKIPASLMDYVKVFQGQADKISYIDAAAFVIVESTKDVIKGAQSVGDSILLTGKIINFLLPALVIGGLLLYANEKSGGGLVRNLKAFKGLK